MAYIDGIVVPVRTENREKYRAMAAKNAKYFREYGALQVVEAWGDDLLQGKLTDFAKAVKAEDGETVVLAWIVWPDKATRDSSWGKIMEDERMRPEGDAPFDGRRMFWGGFEPIVREGA